MLYLQKSKIIDDEHLQKIVANTPVTLINF